jgi:hypothetical protein
MRLPYAILFLTAPACGFAFAQDCQLEGTQTPISIFGGLFSPGLDLELLDSGQVAVSGSLFGHEGGLLAGDDSTSTTWIEAFAFSFTIANTVVASNEVGVYMATGTAGEEDILYFATSDNGDPSLALVNISSSSLTGGLATEAMDSAGDFGAIGQPSFDGGRGRVRVSRLLLPNSPQFGFENTPEVDLTAFNAQPGDRFGEQVAVYSGPERDVIMVGAPGASNGGASEGEGAVYFFVYNDATGNWDFNSWWWVNAPGGLYGSQLDVHGDFACAGAPLANVGATDTGYFNVFEWNGSFYDFGPGFVASPGDMGGSALGIEDGVVVAGVSGFDGPDGNRPDMGGASIIRFDGTNWNVEVPVFYAIDGRAHDRFGSAVSVKNGKVAISSPNQVSPIEGGQPVRIYDISEINGFALAQANPYLGSLGTNEVAVTSSDLPRLGSTWRCNVNNNLVPGQQAATLMAVSDAPADLFIGGEEYLVSITGGNPFFYVFSSNPQIGDIDIPIMPLCEFAGIPFYVQAVSVSTTLVVDFLSPAYELVLGY